MRCSGRVPGCIFNSSGCQRRSAGASPQPKHPTPATARRGANPQLAGPKAAVPPTSWNSRSQRGSPGEAGPRYGFAFKLPDPGVVRSPPVRPPNPGPHPARGEGGFSRAGRGVAPASSSSGDVPLRSAVPGWVGRPGGTPAAGRWDRGGVLGKLGGRESGAGWEATQANGKRRA